MPKVEWVCGLRILSRERICYFRLSGRPTGEKLKSDVCFGPPGLKPDFDELRFLAETMLDKAVKVVTRKVRDYSFGSAK